MGLAMRRGTRCLPCSPGTEPRYRVLTRGAKRDQSAAWKSRMVLAARPDLGMRAAPMMGMHAEP